MYTSRFRGLVALATTVSIVAAVTEIIRRRQRSRSAREIAPGVKIPGNPRGGPVTNSMARASSQQEPADPLVAKSNARSSEGPGSLSPGSGASSSSTIGESELSNAPKLDSTQARERHERSFIGYWISIFLAVTVGCGIAAYFVWQPGFSSNDNPPEAVGGLLIFTDGSLDSYIEASVEANIWQTGFAGISILELTLEFRNAHPGIRWFIAASGQYAPQIDMPLGAFCPGISAVRSSSIIGCRNNSGYGLRDVTYNFKDHIGALEGQEIKTITDSLVGYIDTNTVIVSGILARPYQYQLGSSLTASVFIPFQSPASPQLGSDKYFAYAAVAIGPSSDIGTGASLGRIRNAHPSAFFADSFTRTPINYLPISSLTLSLDVGVGENQLSWASPPTVQSDQLEWSTTGQGIGPVKFTLHDPFAADRLSRDSFIAGVLVAIAASAFLLLLEKLTQWWIDKKKRRVQNYDLAQGKSRASLWCRSIFGWRRIGRLKALLSEHPHLPLSDLCSEPLWALCMPVGSG
jgi:hypothetical protein